MALTRPKYSQIPDTDFKQSVRVATTVDVGNVMLAAMPNSVDGITLQYYDRVLVRTQANAAQNGIYYVKAVGTGNNGIWERTKDADAGSAEGKITPAIITLVEEGTINSGRTFRLTTTGNIDLGTTNLSFGIQTAEPGGATGQLQFANVNNVIGGATTTSYDYTTGNLTLTGNVNTTLLYQAGKRVPQVFTSATPPANPAIGDQWYQLGTDILYEWLSDGGTQYWVDVSGATIANVNPITGETIGTLVVNGGQDSTSATTGALQIAGGVGISGNIFVGGNILTGSGSFGGQVNITTNTPSTSETTGALVIPTPGGIGVGGNIWAGGAIVANSRIPSTSISTGAIRIPGVGGLGVGGNVWVGQDVNVTGNITGGGVRQTISSTAPANPTVGDQWYQLGTDVLYQYVSDGTGKYWVDIAGATVANISAQSQQSLVDIQIVSGTPSTSATTGALTVSGGVGIQGNLNLLGNLNVSGGNIVANQNVASTSTTTGSMVITGQGGLGVGGNIFVGGNLSIAQNASFLQNVNISANLVASGSYFSAAGFSVTNGNIVTTGTSAQIGGLTISNGAISGLTSLGITGDLTVGGNITGGGVRKTSSVSAPVNPVVGDTWYKTDTDVLYTYINDGTKNIWVDYASASVSNANPTSPQSLSDLQIVSGTQSTNTTSGALQVTGGAGITGNVFSGNLSTATVSATNFTYANGVSILLGNEGTYSNANVVAYLATSNISVGGSISASGNLTSSGSYFSAGGLSVTAGNVVASGARAVIGGLTIENGGISSLASLNVIGSGTLGGDFAITGNITAGGLRKYAQINAPANPVVGDVWYKTDTDVFYQYVNDGTNKYWIDYTSATVSNANPTSPQSLQDLQIVSGTPSTGSGTGALQVTGGAAVTGNLFSGNLTTTTVAASAFTYANGVSILVGNEGTYSNANVLSYLAANGITATTAGISTTGNLTASGSYLSAGGFTATSGNIRTTSANIGGVIIESGGIGQLASLGVVGAATIGGDVAITGNITAGGLRKYAQINAPANPVVGDVWYKTDTDVYYQYITDGTKNIWVDYSSATVSNASPTTSQSLQDLQIVSGTPSTSTSTGALVVQGGIGASGNVFVGNVSTATVSAANFTYANGVSILLGNEGTYSNANVTAYLTARTTTISDGYLSTAGLTVTAGNLKTTSANIGGLIIESGGIGQLASLGVVGGATIGADLAVTGNITGGGLRKYAQINAPIAPVVGDVWYKTDTDVYYQYITDGTKNIWVDYSSATVSNASPTQPQTLQDLQIVSGTASSGFGTGALQVTGGAAVTGNVFTGNLSTTTVAAANFTYANGVSILAGNEGTYSNANVTAYLTARSVTIADGNITATGGYLSAGGFTATSGNIRTTSANIGGVIIESGGISALASLAVVGAGTVGGDFAITGNITAGGLRKYAQVGAPVNPVVGDVWYKTDTDVFYQYVNDGTNKYWIDYTSATVSNANPTSPQSLQDLQIVSGTPSTSTTSGALQVTGGAGISGNVFTGNLSTSTVAAANFTYANGVSILAGNEGTYSNSNVTAYLTARSITLADGNITATGGYLSAGGFTATAGNIFASSANIAGVIISNGGLSSLATLGVTGGATIGADLAVTGNITGGGIRKTSSVSAPATPTVGDQWYKTDTDTLYQYINDGTSKYWIDVAGATVSNASITSSQIAYDIVVTTDTQSTSPTTGAIRVQGGIGLIGNIYTTGIADFGGNLTAGNIKANNNLQTNTLAVVQNATVGGTLNVTGAVTTGNLTTGNITGYGFSTNAGNLVATGQYFSAGGMSVTAGNISATGFTTTGGNVIATGSYAQIGGLVIQNGGFGSLASLDVTGAATFGANVDITGRVTGGGIRKTTSVSAPASPVVGDTWYKTDTDTLYQYIHDGTSNYWIDVTGATVANISQNAATVTDLQIVSGTPSTSTSSGALQVAGGVGITGNTFIGGNLTAGNLTTSTINATLVQSSGVVVGTAFTYANGVSILVGNEGTYSNANVTAYLTAKTVAISDAGNITTSGTYFNTAGVSFLNGNITASGQKAVVGGLTIENGGFGSIASLNVIGSAAIGADLAVTGNITGGGLRKYAQVGAPANPVVGDVWYKTDTDVYYQYITDGTKNIWVDYTSATVSNANPTSPQSISDLQIVSGTSATNTTSGALQVLGGVGITGNVFSGNLSTGTVSAGAFTYANGVSILVGNEGTYSNANVTAYLTARSITLADGNITATGNYLSAGGFTATAGNIRTTSANIGGVIIEAGGIGSLASLNVIGGATIGGDVAITGNITGGGIRKTTSVSAPATPTVGDQWYKQDTDTLYQYINDGTTKYWVDVAGATVSNARTSGDQIAYDIVVTTDTQSTSPTTGAVRVQGGIGLIGNIYTTGIADFGGNLTAGNIKANNNLQTTTLQVTSDANVTGNLAVNRITASGNITSSGQYFSAAGLSVTNGNITTTGTTATIAGLQITNGALPTLPTLGVTGLATFGANIDVTGNVNVTGNVMGGGLRKYAQVGTPANPVPGDVWYKTDTDVYYQYINDGTNKYWIDYSSATVSNASPTSLQSVADLAVVGGTPSTSTSTGAVTVIGGIGASGNINAGNISAGTISAGLFTYANGVSILAGNEGTYSNANVTAYLAAGSITVGANIIAGGTYFSAGGLSVTNGNLVATGTTATIGGLVITNGSLPSLPSLGVTGSATIGVDLTVTGNITGGGIRKTQSTTPPANPVVGDLWYKTDTDVYYQYTSDGINKYWIDYVGATVSNAAVDNSTNQNFTIASGTPSTDPTTGALVVVGGVGVTGDINTTGDFTIDGTFTACTAVTAGYLNVADGIDSYGNVIIHGPGTPNYTVQVRSSDAADDVLGIKTSVAGGGFAIDALNNELIGATPMGINANTFSIGIKNSVGTTVQADALKVDTAGNTSIAKTLSVGQHVNVTGNVSASNASFTKVVATTANFATLNLSGTLTVPTLNVTTSIDAPGIRKYAQISAPASPSAGDVWYKTDTDVYYTYVNDGTGAYWIDYVGATVSNAAVSAGTGNDFRITSGTASADTDTGALTVVGGVGVTGNVNIGGSVIATGFYSDNFSFANGRTLADRITGTFSNANVAAYLTTGTVTAGNITVTGTLTAPGIRKTSSTSAPTSPAVGDVWYKTDTDVYYQYINDGTNNVWVDYAGATVSNAAVTAGAATDYAFTSGTPSTSTGTGAVVVSGGVGVSGALHIGGTGDFGGNVTVNNLKSNLNIQTGTLAVSGSGAVVGNLTTGNLATGIATIARADIAGALVVGGDVTITGNITGGGIRKTQSTTAPVNPSVGDLWYKTDTDVYYQYTSDGVNKYWIDYVSATVSNAAVQNSSSVDFTITSGTESTSTTTGALTIIGGVGVTGNINAGNAIATGFYSDNFSFANGRTLADRITGTFSNTNVAAYLTGAITTGNINAGNIATLDITARNVTLSGNITGGGLRKYAQIGAPATPILGDVWYKTDTDVYYQYINDGTNSFWVDYVGPTISNATIDNSVNIDLTIASGTESTSYSTGALRVVGGAGITGNIYTNGIADFGGNLRASNVYANNNTQTNTLAVVQNATVGGTLTVTGAVATGNLTTGNITGYGFTTNAGNLIATGPYFSAAGISATSGVLNVGNIISSGTRAVVGGLTIENGAFGSVASLAVIAGATFGGDVAITGNITAGGLRKYAQTSAPATPVVGDVWYKTDTDVYYQYVNDGTSNYWIDYTSATVSNANPTSPQSLQDLQIVSGTASTSTTSGALQVTGGVGISGNVFTGNLSTSTVSASNFTYANGTSILAGNEGTYSNANVTAYLTARSVTIADGNITATGGYLAAGGFVATAGNIRTTSANIGGVIIESGGIGQLASIGVIGSATIGADLTVTGNITGGGLRKYAQDSAPANPVVGDVWYKTDTDVYYQYINDGTSKYWVDYVGATVSNASITSSQIAYDIVVTTDTQSTSTTTGAVRVQGGIGLIGNIYTTGIADFGGNLRAGNVYANNNTQTNTLAVINNATIGGTLDVTGSLSAATLSAGNSTVGNIAGYGFTTNAGNLTASGAYFSAGGMSSTNGNITVGNINAYSFIVSNGNITSTGTYARVGGLEIINGGFGSLASLGVVGGATIGADLAVTGNITGGGLRKTQSTTPPANPVQGDVWYKTDTDVYYQYINDGNASYWIDYVSATVANITQNAATVSDLQIVSGTPSTDYTNGALTVAGGVGVSGNINTTGNISTTKIVASAFTYANGVSILVGNEGTYSNANVTGYLTGQGVGTTNGNLTSTGSYFSAGGMTSTNGNITVGNINAYSFIVSNGNITSTGTRAVVGGLTIENGGFADLASLGIIGRLTVGGNLDVTGAVTGGGIRKTTSTSAPVNPYVGDLWYKTDTDVLYQFVNDGTNNYWVDYSSASVANAQPTSQQSITDLILVSGTQSTSSSTGALQVAGGIGVTGNINSDGNIRAGNITASNTIRTTNFNASGTASVATLNVFGNVVITGDLISNGLTIDAQGNVVATGTAATIGGLGITAGNITGTNFNITNGNISATGAYFSAGGLSVTNGNIVATGTTATIGGLVITNGGFGAIASLAVTGGATIGADLAVTGNITGGGLRKTQSTTPPVNPVPGDVWYKTDTDVYYQYINDGTASYWIDYVSATVANITQNAATVSDLQIVSGTASTNTSTGALTVAGGIGVTGDVNIGGNVAVGNVSAGTVYTPTVRASSFTYPNGASILSGYYFGTYSNANIVSALAANGITATSAGITTTGNLSASGTYFSAAGLTVLNGNVTATGTTATIGGLVISNGGFGSIASLNVIGAATIGADLAVTGNITGGGIRKTTSISSPVNPVVGDLWYKTDTDVLYQYLNDGTSNVWIDFASATVANITAANAQYGTDVAFVSGTTSTSPVTGAVQIAGGLGIVGNINLTGQVTTASTLTAQAIVSNTSVTGATLSITGNASVGNITGYGFTTNNGNVTATGNIGGYGFATNNGNLSASGAYFSAGGMSSTNGNITVGNINAYSFIVSNGNVTATGTYARIGGLEIINGGFGSLASLGVTGAATFGANVDITGRVTGGGIRKTSSTSAPASPVVGDQWYKTDTDILYQYINDGTSNYWIDMASASVANVTQSAQTVSDLAIVSGTPSTSTSTGALRVAGGVGITGDIYTDGNLSTGQISAGSIITNGFARVQGQLDVFLDAFIQGNTVTIQNNYTVGDAQVDGNVLLQKELRVGGNVTAYGLSVQKGNLTANGAYFSAGGLSSTSGAITGTGFSIVGGNVITTGQKAVVGGLTIENGGFGAIASLNVIGSATIGADLAVTGNITGGGLRKYAQTSAPTNPVVGDVWYKTDTDVYYQYITDGSTNIWVDFVSATVANITAANAQYGTDVAFVSGTLSTNPTSGAVQIAGGLGIIGNINVAGNITSAGVVRVQDFVSNTSIAGATLSIAGDTSVGNLTVGNITGYGFTTNNGNVVATGKLTVGGLSVVPGNLSATGTYFSAGGLTSLNGNVTATGITATIGGLTITNGGFGAVSVINVTGNGTVGGNLTVTGNITGGGIRKTTSLTAPAGPTVGDQWYKTDTDILYQYINDGTSTYWVDVASATVANITNNFDGLGDFTTIGNVIANGFVSDKYYYANGVSFVTTTVANTSNIVANISNGFNLGLDLTPTGVTPGTYGSAISIPTVVVDDKGRISSITSNAVSTTFGLTGNVGSSSISGGNTLVVVGVPNQISTTVTGNTISIGFTPNISFTDFTVTGNLIYQGGGIKTTTSPTPPTGPSNGDMWYQSGTDILYRYVYDGTNEYWLDLFSTPLRAILPSRDLAGGDGEVQFNDNGTFGANVNFAFDKTTGTLKAERFRITKSQSPATPTSPGVQGEITWDGNWMYVCVAPNSWVRAGLYTW